uniref:Aminotransferase-like plant mobile domain-containing protein n=1 Tax=Fagus sylvatica TaxID=28930 RepID=A0A2N9GQR7_FAGSY
MASSSSAPVSPPLQPSSGERLEANPGLAAPSPVSGEAEDPQEGFAAPLIDPWYTSSPLFPPKSVDFSHPVEDWDWTVSGVEPTVDQAWVPGLEEISELLIQKGDLQATPINFDFLCAASKDWSHWVDREILDPDFWDSLVDAEIHWAILISRSCNMFRDTEAMRELLRRWCPSTHTFFFSWGELTPTLEDVANHWMLPILGEHSFSNIKLSTAEEEIAAVLKKHSSTRLSGWPSTFINYKKAPIRRAAFILYWLCKCTFGNFPCYSVNTIFIPLAIRISVGHCFPLAPLFLGHLYSQLNLLHDCEIAGDSCFILSTVFNTSALQTFFWEHSTSYIYAARDRSAAWGKLSDLPQKFLDQFPSFRDNLPLVYRWASLKPRDHDLVEALDYEENVLFRPYGDDHPGFTCASVFRKLYGPTPLIRDLKAEDYRSLSYLSTVKPGLPPSLVCHRCFLHSLLSTAAFLKSSAFARWGGEGTRVLIPGGHRFGFNTASMGAYWQRLTRSMVDYVIAGRTKNLGFAEWDSARGGWVAYTIHLPEGWKSSVNVVEDRLIMPSKRGKVNKRDAPTDPVFERTPKKSAPTASSSKKAPSKKAKVAKQGKTPLLVPSAAGASTTALAQGATKSAVAPSKRKTRAGKESKSTPSVPSTAEESTEAFMEEPIESAVSPAEKTKVGKESKSTTSVPLAAKESMAAPVEESVEPTVASSRSKRASPAKQAVKKGAASDPPRGQKKVSVSSSTDEEEPSAVPIPSPPKKKKFTAPLFPLGAAGRTRSKSGPKVVRGSGGSGGDTDSDVAEEDIDAGPPEEDAPSAAAVDQTENLGKSAADSSEIGIELVSAESTADDEDMPEADDSSVGAAGSMDEDLAIVPHAGYDDDSAVDADVDPISFSLPQPVLTSAAGGFVIPAGHFTSEDSPVVEGALMPEEIHAQGLVESGSVVDLGHDAPLEGAGASAVDVLAGSDHLENIVISVHRLGCRLMKTFRAMDLVVVSLECCPMKYRLGCRLDGKILVSMDLVVILWKILFHGLGCRPMENFSFHGLGCRPYGGFLSHGLGCCPMEDFWLHGFGCHPMKDFFFFCCFHGLGCCPMEDFVVHGLGCCPMEDFVVPWTWLLSYGRFCCSMDLVVVLWKILLFHGLGCCPMEDFDLIKSWESSRKLNLIMNLLVVTSLLICLVLFLPFFAGADDAVHVSEEIDEVGITGEVTVVSPPRRPTIEVGSSIDVSSLSSEVAAFLREFDARAPNPHPEQFFWSFNGPLVPFGDFWVPNDCSPYLSRLSAGHSDFTKGFKLSIGLGGPMMSLLGSVLAAMDESSLEDVTKTQILAWRSVIQDLMDVGFDLGFMMERLRQMAQCVFGKRLTDEIKALQHQIALLQDSLAKLTAYQDAMMSTGEVVPRSERGGSFLDSLLD